MRPGSLIKGLSWVIEGPRLNAGQRLLFRREKKSLCNQGAALENSPRLISNPVKRVKMMILLERSALISETLHKPKSQTKDIVKSVRSPYDICKCQVKFHAFLGLGSLHFTERMTC